MMFATNICKTPTKMLQALAFLESYERIREPVSAEFGC